MGTGGLLLRSTAGVPQRRASALNSFEAGPTAALPVDAREPLTAQTAGYTSEDATNTRQGHIRGSTKSISRGSTVTACGCPHCFRENVNPASHLPAQMLPPKHAACRARVTLCNTLGSNMDVMPMFRAKGTGGALLVQAGHGTGYGLLVRGGAPWVQATRNRQWEKKVLYQNRPPGRKRSASAGPKQEDASWGGWVQALPHTQSPAPCSKPCLRLTALSPTLFQQLFSTTS